MLGLELLDEREHRAALGRLEDERRRGPQRREHGRQEQRIGRARRDLEELGGEHEHPRVDAALGERLHAAARDERQDALADRRRCEVDVHPAAAGEPDVDGMELRPHRRDERVRECAPVLACE